MFSSITSYLTGSDSQQQNSNASNSASFVEAMNAPEALTENGARSYATVCDGRVELFFKTVRGLQGSQLENMLARSWTESPLDTLRIVFNARDCRGGKGERQLFLDCMRWISRQSAPAVLSNLELVPEYGRWLDLVQLSGNSQISETVWQMLAHKLNEDRALMMEGKPISLCAKWIPSEGSKWDKKLGASRQIAAALGVDMRRLRTEYLTPLRKYLNIVERYMCEREWTGIDYSKVPSVAMNRLKKAFAKNDAERFEAWKQALAIGRPDVKVNAKVLFPHDLVRQYLSGYGVGGSFDQVVESQWAVLRDETAKLGDLGRTLVISDVSGSMCGTPLEVSIALGLLVSEVVPEPFKNKVVTFSSQPKFHNIEGRTLQDRVRSIHRADWQMSTDFIAVFKLILGKAKQHGVPADKMPNRLVVISDMQFNQASTGNYDSNFSTVQKMYKAAGYELPQIVFWNVRAGTTDFPVASKNEPGVALIAGFSPAILKSVIECKDFTPYGVMRTTLDSDRYAPVSYGN